jgi:hypothetical protein
MSGRRRDISVHSIVDNIAKTTSPATMPIGRCNSGAPLRFLREVNVSVDMSPSLVVVTTAAVTFLSCRLGNMFGVVDSRNSGATGAPSNWKRCNLGPKVGSIKICQLWNSSVKL